MPLQKLSDAVHGRPAAAPPPTAGPVAPLLPSERAAETLASRGSDGPRPGQLWRPDSGSSQQGGPVKVYRWIEFGTKEHTTEFGADHFQLEGHFESNSSEGHKEFQDRLRCIHFRKEGKSKAEIARLTGRSEKFVAKWWQKDEREVPRPWGVHEYLSKEMGQRTSTNLPGVSDGPVADTATWWRDVEIRRKYCEDPAIYEELLQNTDWQSRPARTRDFSTGASYVKYDKEGNMKQQTNQAARYVRGSSPAMDRLLQRFFSEYGLADRTSGIGLNWYPDGQGVLGSHRHDCWTALFSFGHERILTIDKTPLLLQDSDLVIFGTQRHGVPLMPEVTGGRITVPIFFFPDHLQMKKQWQTLTDPEDPRRSRELAKMEREHGMVSEAMDSQLWADPARAVSLAQLTQLGFDAEAARAALRSAAFDVDLAAELLLMAGETAHGSLEFHAQAPSCCGGGEDRLQLEPRIPRGRFHRPRAPLEGCPSAASSSPQPTGNAAREGASEQDATHDPGGDTDADADVALAWQLQLQEEEEGGHCFLGPPDDRGDVDAAIAAQLEEEFAVEAPQPDLLEAQFQEYEEQFRRDDAEDWHGHGDLMQSTLARETLTLDTMDKVTCYSIGHGTLLEKDFYELLQLSSIRVLYDLRAADHRGDVHSPCQHFAVRELKRSCKARGISYRHIALGREGAYGILKHVESDEAKHALVELAWHAKRARTAFLGFDLDWRQDARQVIADAMVKAGHSVKHIDSTGATEDHRLVKKYPDFILQEENRLRKLEKMRQDGALKAPVKSAVDRSSEAIAAKLLRPAQTVDAMDELRAAANQVELVRAQRKLARIQRIGEKYGALANKVLEGTPHWILEEARLQETWIAEKKAQKALVKEATASQDSSATPGAAKTPPDTFEDPVVECAGCAQPFSWSLLASGDGRCERCALAWLGGDEVPFATSLAASGAASSSTPPCPSGHPVLAEEPSTKPEQEDFTVACTRCGVLGTRSELQMSDCTCTSCADAAAATGNGQGHVAGATARPASSWRARRQQAAAATVAVHS